MLGNRFREINFRKCISRNIFQEIDLWKYIFIYSFFGNTIPGTKDIDFGPRLATNEHPKRAVAVKVIPIKAQSDIFNTR